MDRLIQSKYPWLCTRKIGMWIQRKSNIDMWIHFHHSETSVTSQWSQLNKKLTNATKSYNGHAGFLCELTRKKIVFLAQSRAIFAPDLTQHMATTHFLLPPMGMRHHSKGYQGHPPPPPVPLHSHVPPRCSATLPLPASLPRSPQSIVPPS